MYWRAIRCQESCPKSLKSTYSRLPWTFQMRAAPTTQAKFNDNLLAHAPRKRDEYRLTTVLHLCYCGVSGTTKQTDPFLSVWTWQK